MIEKINNSKLNVDDIYRLPSSSTSRLKQIRLDKNERADPHVNFFLKKLKQNISSNLISAYPEFDKIYKKLSKKLKVSTNNLVFTAGSDQAIKNTFELFYRQNKKVITINPTFAMVDIYCKIFKTKQVRIGYDKNLQLRIQDLIKSIDQNTCLVIIANPNSPTGTLINKNDLIKILKKAKKFNAKVLIDEAYYEFSTYNFLPKIKTYNNLIIIRTFSKIFGFAGLRCGYVVSDKKIINKYFSIKPMYEINSIAVKALELVLSSEKFTKLYLKEMRDGEQYAKRFCKKNNYKFIKCHANFFHICFNYDPEKIQNYLSKKNILIKGGPGVNPFEKYLRISFARKSTISSTLNEIKKYLSKYR